MTTDQLNQVIMAKRRIVGGPRWQRGDLVRWSPTEPILAYFQEFVGKDMIVMMDRGMGLVWVWCFAARSDWSPSSEDLVPVRLVDPELQPVPWQELKRAEEEYQWQEHENERRWQEQEEMARLQEEERLFRRAEEMRDPFR